MQGDKRKQKNAHQNIACNQALTITQTLHVNP